jgi:hypothetical protein
MCCQLVPSREGQQRRKEPIELQLLIEMTGEPAGAPLARSMQLHRPAVAPMRKYTGMTRGRQPAFGSGREDK